MPRANRIRNGVKDGILNHKFYDYFFHVRCDLIINQWRKTALLCFPVPPTAPGVTCQMRCTQGQMLTGRF